MAHLPDEIRIDCTTPHRRQRYNTVGDWEFKDHWLRNTLIVHVSGELYDVMGKPEYAILVAVHEMIEALLCIYNDVPQKDVDDFDRSYEVAREAGKTYAPCGCLFGEPGDDKHAPYHHQHVFATMIEEKMAQWFAASGDFSARDYAKACEEVSELWNRSSKES